MICVDASVAIKWVLAEEYSTQALALVTVSGSSAQPIVAPPLLPIEATNTIRQRMRRQGLALAEAERLLEQFLAFPVTIIAPRELHREALIIADAYQLPAVYDAHYVALAQWLDCPLWTSDRRLLRAVNGKLSFVRWIGDYAPEGAG